MARLSNLLLTGALLVALSYLNFPHFTDGSPITSPTETGLVVHNPPINVTTVSLQNSNTDLALSPRAQRYSDNLIMASMTSNTAIAGAICVAASFGICIAAGIVAVLLNYLTIWYGAGVVKRSVEFGTDASIQVHPEWHSLGTCSTSCMFFANAPANTWTPFGNATVGGLYFEVHAFHDGVEGGVRGLMSIQGDSSTATNSRRQIEVDDGGATTQFYFYDVAETNWDDYVADYDGDLDDTADATASAIQEFSASTDSVVMCANMQDGDGTVNYGLWTFGWDDNFYGESTATVESQLGTCESIG